MDKHTYNMGVVGNCAFLAHIATNTNVEWMCWPFFDSSFIFGGLLDRTKGGEFNILPPETEFDSRQYYIENTNILCTEIRSEEGAYRVTDFAPRFFQYDRYFKPLMFIRKVEPLEGTPRVVVNCKPVGGYGDIKPSRHRASNHIKFLGLAEEIRLTTNVPLTYIMEEQFFVLNEEKYLVLTYGAPLEAPLARTVESFLWETTNYWRRWVKSTSIGDFSQNQVIRSALVLKMHQFEDTGAIIASATTSLPESPGSGRNWDYRYCWLRDAYYTLNAFNNIGHFEELELYFNYIANLSTKAKKNERFQPLYSLSGSDTLLEQELELEGYRGNQPVRIGNQAYEHIQNDVYGQILISLLPLYIDQRFITDERTESYKLVMDVLQKIYDTIDEPDAGIWEFRHLAQYHCYTNLFHWAGSSAALRVAKVINDAKMARLARELQQKSIEKIEACYDPKRKVYTQAVGNPNLDASTLQLIMMNYLDPNSERARNHLLAIERELRSHEHGLMYRYMHNDDFGKPDSTFMICSFWYIEALACIGEVERAIEEFQAVIKHTNHLGLLSEDVDARSGSQWGNFPQTYSHVGLMNAAYRITNKLDKPTFL